MRWLIRWAFNFSAVASGVLFVAVCVLWMRSYGRKERVVYWPTPFRGLCITSVGGAVQWKVQAEAFNRYPGVREAEVASLSGPDRGMDTLAERYGNTIRRWEDAETPHQWSRRLPGLYLGGDARRHTGLQLDGWDNRYRVTFLTTRHWVLAVAALALPLARLRRVWRRRRRACPSPTTVCTSCSYDLRATPGQCPECGHVPERA